MARNSTKRALLFSVLALVLCMSMFVGTTYAWFTDSVTSSNNIIKAGTLNVEMYWANGTEEPADAKWNDASKGAIFDYSNWEPGYAEVRHIKIENKGTLAFNYKLNVIANGKVSELADVIDVYYVDPAVKVSDRTQLTADVKIGTLSDILSNLEAAESTATGTLIAGGNETVTIALKMQETAGNQYQGLGIGTSFSIQLIATQATVEKDSFDEFYDEDAAWANNATYEWYEEGEKTGTYSISTPSDLAGLANIVNGTATSGIATFSNTVATLQDSFKGKKVVLTADVDLMNNPWMPIGNKTNSFQGEFDGNGHTVKNLYVAGGNNSNVGFFGYTTNGTVKNLTIENASVSGRLNVGVVAGTPYTTSYDNITVKGLVSVNGMAYVGGAFGKNVYNNVSNVTVDVEEGSCVTADSVENGTAYRTYVGGVIGFMGEGGHTVSNVYSNIDVVGSTRDIGGITGIAHYGNSFENCVSEGNVSVTKAAEIAAAEEMGGIAGVWHNGGADVTFTNCVFKGELSANVAADLSNNLIVGAAYSSNGSGTLIIDGYSCKVLKDAEDIAEALTSGGNVILSEDVKTEAATTAPYGNKYAFAQNGGVIDGNGNELYMECYGDDYGIMTSGGTIKNLTIREACRAIMIMYATEDIIVDNVNIGGDGVLYPINTGEAGADGVKLIVTNSTLAGWTSFSNIESASFTNVKFEQGTYYNDIYGRVVKPYVNTTFTNCSFIEHMNLDLSGLAEDQKVVFSDCTVNGQEVTADVFTVPATDADYDTELFTVDLPSWANSIADCIVIN